MKQNNKKGKNVQHKIFAESNARALVRRRARLWANSTSDRTFVGPDPFRFGRNFPDVMPHNQNKALLMHLSKNQSLPDLLNIEIFAFFETDLSFGADKSLDC